jgi:hypothetical protein
MVGASAANPLGFWEPREVVKLNFAILHRHGSPFFDPSLRLQEVGAIGAAERAACIDQIGEFFTTLPAAPLTVIKEPSLSALSDMWFEAAGLAGFDVMAAIALRHPQEVVASLAKLRTHSSPELANALWLKYMLLSERDTRHLPRVFVEYANLLDDWRREVRRISSLLAIDLDTRDEDAIDEFLKPDHRHQQQRGPVTDSFGAGWIPTVYEMLGAASRDEPWDRSAIDRVYEGYRASERDFRMVFNDFRRLQKLDRFTWPRLTGLALEVVAMAHRRKGTWA